MIRKIAIIIISRKEKTKHKLCIMLLTWGTSSPKLKISLLLLELFIIISIVFVCAEEIMGESDFKHAKGSSTKFLSLRERDSLAYSQTLHRKLRNVMVTQKNFDKGLEEIDFLNCAKTKCRGPFSQKLHNVPSGPNPIGNFASMGVQPP